MLALVAYALLSSDGTFGEGGFRPCTNLLVLLSQYIGDPAESGLSGIDEEELLDWRSSFRWRALALASSARFPPILSFEVLLIELFHASVAAELGMRASGCLTLDARDGFGTAFLPSFPDLRVMRIPLASSFFGLGLRGVFFELVVSTVGERLGETLGALDDEVPQKEEE